MILCSGEDIFREFEAEVDPDFPHDDSSIGSSQTDFRCVKGELWMRARMLLGIDKKSRSGIFLQMFWSLFQKNRDQLNGTIILGVMNCTIACFMSQSAFDIFHIICHLESAGKIKSVQFFLVTFEGFTLPPQKNTVHSLGWKRSHVIFVFRACKNDSSTPTEVFHPMQGHGFDREKPSRHGKVSYFNCHGL